MIGSHEDQIMQDRVNAETLTILAKPLQAAIEKQNHESPEIDTRQKMMVLMSIIDTAMCNLAGMVGANFDAKDHKGDVDPEKVDGLVRMLMQDLELRVSAAIRGGILLSQNPGDLEDGRMVVLDSHGNPKNERKN